MTRSKKQNTPYIGEKDQMQSVFEEYLSCAADCFCEPYDNRTSEEADRGADNMAETSCHAEDSRKYREQKHVVKELQEAIVAAIDADDILWQTVIAFQNYPFYTSSGLPFSYMVKCKKNGDYSGELIVSRKEGSKTLTKSSVMLAFHKVLESITTEDVLDRDGEMHTVLVPLVYKGPKEIGQIFGISYVYSMFWKWGLIMAPHKVQEKMRGKNLQ
jgi:hypothetical protein